MLSPFQRSNKFRSIPSPGGETAQEASSIYSERYGQLPIPATAYATSTAGLRSINNPSALAPQWESSVVQRANKRDGMIATGGRQYVELVTPQVMDPPDSSKFQNWLIGPQVDYILNGFLYRCGFPAALAPGRDPLDLSTRVDQIPTRTSGGPGPGTMRSAPRFKAVQTVPRYSTMPPTYPTASSKG